MLDYSFRAVIHNIIDKYSQNDHTSKSTVEMSHAATIIPMEPLIYS